MIHRRALLATLALPAVARAQTASFPTRQVRIVVPFPPGGGLDALARAIADRLQAEWGQPVVVDNRPGGSTVPGTDIVAKAPPDGHTLLITADNSITSNPVLIRGLPHDPMRDLAPITLLVDVHQMVLVHPSIGANTMGELVAAARANPGRLNFGSYGNASQPHLAFGALMAKERIEMVHVPYRGLTPAVTATLAGEVQMTLAGIASGAAHIRAGTLKALAVGKPTRFEALPDVPTLKEAGYDDIDPRTWFGAFAPAGTPPELLLRLHAAIAAAMAAPMVRDRHLAPAGYTVHLTTPEATAAFLREDLDYKRRLIAAAGIQPE
ncbi:tripartite tricarboxylate transporter substrate binding protein [Falsiroseomonas bella]|uniref:Tripartite tricarboxylate transporter substrate binding protein n=1 Tax=Falsiroseomonas bella TaxID=2184016 RepID=A0A317FFY4_9PROT|nr:tripartite tricarboxylate transporter substrate-binding protein [Falsiroseomonas bella]PWS37282.1 tripartite tricarboxylate transporter substrate binding protein [Falsiroseomonas bella]